MLTLLAFALAAEPPTTEALLALPRVHCVGPDGLQWSRVTDANGWVLTLGYVQLRTGRSQATELERVVTSAAKRNHLEGAPWQWSERIAVRTTDGTPVAEHPRAIEAVDATFTCTDLTDSTSRWIDRSQWWDADPGAEDRPAPGVVRCRSVDPDIVWISRDRFAGIAPRDGDVLRSTMLAVDGIQVGGETLHRGGAKPTAEVGGAVTGDLESSTPIETSDDRLRRSRAVYRFTRPDGSELVPGKTELRATLECESYDYPPPPRAPSR